MDNSLKILVTASLDAEKSITAIDKELKTLAARLDAVKLEIKIDDKATKILADYSKAMENQKKITSDLNRVLTEHKTITKESGNVTKEVITQTLKSGEVIQKEISRIDNRTQSRKKETRNYLSRFLKLKN